MYLTITYKTGAKINFKVSEVSVKDGFIHYDLDEKTVFIGHLPFGKIPLTNVEHFDITKED